MKYLLLTFVFFTGIMTGFAQSSPETKPSTEGLKVAMPPTIDERVDGLGNRSDLIKHLCNIDSDFVFKQIKDIDGRPDFYASDRYNTSVEIVGNENDLVMVKWTFRMIFYNNAATHMEVNRMGDFAGGIGGKDGFEWFSNIFLKFKDKPLNDYTETKQLFFNRVAEFYYTPQLKKMTLTVTVKKDK